MIHPYAFIRPLERLPDVVGLGHAAIEQLCFRDVAVVYSRHEERLEGDPRADAVAHGLVVEALASAAASVAPIRFGEAFADESRLEAAVEERLSAIEATLERVADCVELGVRVAAPVRRGSVVASNGTAYLQDRLAALHEVDLVMSELHERVASASREASVSSRGVFEAAYLVECGRVAEAEQHVRDFTVAHPELTVVCTGPWAPYSFTGAVS